MQTNLEWKKCGEDKHWCSLKNLTLPLNGNPSGIYIIWYRGTPGKVVRVGQGNISDRLTVHRKDREILAHSKNGTLRVTWATVPPSQRDGIERYLADTWNPLVGDAFPDVRPIKVNSPW